MRLNSNSHLKSEKFSARSPEAEKYTKLKIKSATNSVFLFKYKGKKKCLCRLKFDLFHFLNLKEGSMISGGVYPFYIFFPEFHINSVFTMDIHWQEGSLFKFQFRIFSDSCGNTRPLLTSSFPTDFPTFLDAHLHTHLKNQRINRRRDTNLA